MFFLYFSLFENIIDISQIVKYNNNEVIIMRLRELREQKGLNQKEFAALIGVPANTYNQWEKEKRSPDYEMLSQIANFYDVSVDYLLGRTDNPEQMRIPAEDEPSKLTKLQEAYEQADESIKLAVDKLLDL